MSYGICNLSIVPVRKSPDGKLEMVTQLLFGELFEVMNLKEIGLVLGVSESRVSQIHSQAALRLRSRMQGWGRDS